MLKAAGDVLGAAELNGEVVSEELADLAEAVLQLTQLRLYLFEVLFVLVALVLVAFQKVKLLLDVLEVLTIDFFFSLFYLY